MLIWRKQSQKSHLPTKTSNNKETRLINNGNLPGTPTAYAAQSGPHCENCKHGPACGFYILWRFILNQCNQSTFWFALWCSVKKAVTSSLGSFMNLHPSQLIIESVPWSLCESIIHYLNESCVALNLQRTLHNPKDVWIEMQKQHKSRPLSDMYFDNGQLRYFCNSKC